jgi:hypothetical protein
MRELCTEEQTFVSGAGNGASNTNPGNSKRAAPRTRRRTRQQRPWRKEQPGCGGGVGPREAAVAILTKGAASVAPSCNRPCGPGCSGKKITLALTALAGGRLNG